MARKKHVFRPNRRPRVPNTGIWLPYMSVEAVNWSFGIGAGGELTVTCDLLLKGTVTVRPITSIAEGGAWKFLLLGKDFMGTWQTFAAQVETMSVLAATDAGTTVRFVSEVMPQIAGHDAAWSEGGWQLVGAPDQTNITVELAREVIPWDNLLEDGFRPWFTYHGVFGGLPY